MRGNAQFGGSFCPRCRQYTQFTRASMTWGCGDLIMVMISFGFWIPLRYLLNGFTNPWCCNQCGYYKSGVNL